MTNELMIAENNLCGVFIIYWDHPDPATLQVKCKYKTFDENLLHGARKNGICFI